MKNQTVLGITFGLAIIALLIVLPKTPITITGKFINIDTQVGGYNLELFGKRLDLSEFKTGLDIKGGVKVVLKADMTKIEEGDRDSALESAKNVITRRVDFLGVSEPVIQTSKGVDDYRIIVELPGVSDVSSALSLIGQTAQLTFKQLKSDIVYSEANFQEYYLNPEVWEDSGVTGADLKGADVVFDTSVGASSTPQIRLRFSNEGRQKFSDVAKANVGEPIAIFLDEGQVPISMPVVNADLAQGLTSDPVITGSFSVEEANALSISLRAGALPVPVSVIEQRTIGATLGEESIKKSITAGVIGVLFVLAFMLVNYGRLGLFANVALLVYGVTTLAIFKLVPVVITLPGLAGFILSIGMAVDANILIFERIKEEIAWGKPFNLALRLGFERAWPSIKDSNISSLLTSGVLFYFGTGVVRGFALTLAIGVLVSMLTAIYVTRGLVETFYGHNR